MKICFTYFPHGNLVVAEKEKIDLAGHVRWLLHEHIVVEEVLDTGDATDRLQLLAVGPLRRLIILSGVASLVEPELPLGVHRVSSTRFHRVISHIHRDYFSGSGAVEQQGIVLGGDRLGGLEGVWHFLS